MKKAGRAPGLSAARPLATRLYTMGKPGTVKVFEFLSLEIAADEPAFPAFANQFGRVWLNRGGGITIFVEKS